MSTPSGTREAGTVYGGRRLLDLPAEDRPRERLLRHGAGALSNRELLAVVLGTGTRNASALDVAASLLESGLRGLAGRSPGELEAQRGLGLPRPIVDQALAPGRIPQAFEQLS